MSDKLREEQPKDILGRPITPSTTASTNCPLEGKPFECVCCKRLTAENAALVEQQIEIYDASFHYFMNKDNRDNQERFKKVLNKLTDDLEARSALERSDEA